MIRKSKWSKKGMGRASPSPAAPAARATASPPSTTTAGVAARDREDEHDARGGGGGAAHAAREAAARVAVEQLVAPRPLERRRVHAVDPPQSIHDLVVPSL